MAKLRAGVVILVFMILLGLVFGSNGTMNMEDSLSSPSPGHIFGCDGEGRDLFRRTCSGFLTSFTVSAGGTLFAFILSMLLLFISMESRAAGKIILSSAKAVRTVPQIVLALFFLSAGGRGSFFLVMTLALSSSVVLFLLLNPLLRTGEREDSVIAERSLGIREGKIFFHIIYSMKGLIGEHLASSAVSMMITESSLSFLGLGISPDKPTIGRILSEGRSVVLTHPHVVIFPSAFLFLFGLAVILIQKGLGESDATPHGPGKSRLVDIAEVPSDRNSGSKS